MCKPCVKAKLACSYELPPGQTRAQAMMESQQRLRDELHSHASLVHTLRVSDANASIQMLSHLRHGDYDSALLGNELAIRTNSSGDKLYPWEEYLDDSQRHRTQDSELHPPIDAFPPVRQEGTGYPLPRPVPEQTAFPYDRAALPSPAYPTSSTGPHGMSVSHPMMDGSSIPAYNQRMPSYQHPDMQAQVPRPSSYQQQGDVSNMPTVPSNDPNRVYVDRTNRHMPS